MVPGTRLSKQFLSGPEQNWTGTVQNWTGDGTKLDSEGFNGVFRCLGGGRSGAEADGEAAEKRFDEKDPGRGCPVWIAGTWCPL
ncbi:MAG: hypothetical protein D4R65_02910 [Verrucomicrobiaceae bacterium]|nr:MAG: hypothetical protein D4R65_02910 [Verrucomicrobiaceae bacterium]